MNHDIIDLRSDTVTLPTDEMREAMYRAEVGDSMRGEDPTMNRLEALAAEKMGKEAAIYVTSGTQGNLVSLMAHTTHGDEVIFEADHHSYYYEVGGFAAIRGLSPVLIRGKFGVMDPVDIEKVIRPPSPFFPRTSLLFLENTHNRAGGNAITLEEMEAMTGVARKHGLSVHLDGARIFNAAIALGIPAKDITRYADSVQFCLSKGLSAPVGSIVAGSAGFIERAKQFRKLLGGDLRQSGVLAAAGIVALEKMVDRLADDHQTAKILAEGLSDIPCLAVDHPPHPTNMVFFDTKELGIDAARLVTRLKEEGVLAAVYAATRVRLVTHRHIDEQMVKHAIRAIQTVTASY